MPDCFPVVHAIVPSSSRALGQRWRHAQQALPQATEALARQHGGLQALHEASALGQARQAEGTRWAEAHPLSRGHLENRALTLHPFRLADSTPQTAAEVARQLTAAVEAIDAGAQGQQLPTRQSAMSKVRKQGPALAARVDFWWHGVHQD